MLMILAFLRLLKQPSSPVPFNWKLSSDPNRPLCLLPAGTLTLNQLSVDRDTVLAVSGRPLDDILRDSALSANIVGEEPIDVVLHESYPGNATLWDNYKVIRSVPFNPVDKYTIAIVQENATGLIRRYMKGAPQVGQWLFWASTWPLNCVSRGALLMGSRKFGPKESMPDCSVELSRFWSVLGRFS